MTIDYAWMDRRDIIHACTPLLRRIYLFLTTEQRP